MKILGLSVATTEHHAAALVCDGQLVAAAEEERFNRIKHYGARVGDRADANLINDGDLWLRDVMCKEAVRYVLQAGGIHRDDVDWIAVNGIPFRYSSTYSLTDPSRPPQPVEEGRIFYIPHHLCHAASAYRLSGFDRSNVFTIDGRGERETAAFFSVGDAGELVRHWDVLYGEGQSFGGCYETVSRYLGWGSHGQGVVMAQAALGQPSLDFGEAIHVDDHLHYRLDERKLADLLGRLSLQDGQAQDVAASAQAAVEGAAAALVREGFDAFPSPGLCLAGGVTLNCPLNGRLFRESGADRVFAQPAAHDAGTAIGAALEAAAILGEPPPAPMNTAAWGPAYDEAEIERVLEEDGVSYRRVDSIADAVADRLAEGKIVCRFDGRMEIGPRALGQRSILADPRSPEMKARLNSMKNREPWRPFGPSVLEAHVDDYLPGAFASPFMLFTFDVEEERREEIPVVVHGDGSTRPQTVDPAILPAFGEIIEAFHARTGVPMVVNTSFNQGGEPLVCSPSDALQSWRGLGADVLQMGPFLLER